MSAPGGVAVGPPAYLRRRSASSASNATPSAAPDDDVDAQLNRLMPPPPMFGTTSGGATHATLTLVPPLVALGGEIATCSGTFGAITSSAPDPSAITAPPSVAISAGTSLDDEIVTVWPTGASIVSQSASCPSSSTVSSQLRATASSIASLPSDSGSVAF